MTIREHESRLYQHLLRGLGGVLAILRSYLRAGLYHEERDLKTLQWLQEDLDILLDVMATGVWDHHRQSYPWRDIPEWVKEERRHGC